MVEITGSEELRGWLEGQPQDVAFVIAARCALRVQPFLARVIVADIEEQIQKALLLDSFRAVHTSCVAAVFPSQVGYFSINASTTRAYDAYFDAATYKPGEYGNAFCYADLNWAKVKNAVNAAHAANSAHAYDFLTAVNARNAADAALDPDPRNTMFPQYSVGSPKFEADIGYCFAVSNAATAEVANADYVAASAGGRLVDVGVEFSNPDRAAGYAAQTAVWTAISADCSNSKKMDPSSLLAMPVWPNGWPAWFEAEMPKYFAHLASPEWEFWKHWYLGMLNGDALDWAEQSKIANIPNADWEAGPERIAAVLKGAPVKREPFLRP
jgi:hypothetical protein